MSILPLDHHDYIFSSIKPEKSVGSIVCRYRKLRRVRCLPEYHIQTFASKTLPKKKNSVKLTLMKMQVTLLRLSGSECSECKVADTTFK